VSVLNSGTAEDALKARLKITERIKQGAPAPAPVPKRLPIDAIERIPALFQPRGSDDWRSSSHVNGLASSITKAREADGGAKIEAVLVFWVGDAWACLDGHHRLAAIQKKNRAGASVGVEVFSGTIEEAMMEATRRNSRNKLSMNEKDKSERAWQLFLTSAGTHKAIAEACGVSTKSIQRMAEAVKRLGSTPEGLETLRALHWWQVRLLLQPGRTDELSPDERRHGRIQRRAEALGKVIKDDSPGTVAEALMLRDPEFAKAVMLQLRKIYLRENPFNIGPDGLPEFPEDEPEGEPVEF
jgi:hypothetical protein